MSQNASELVVASKGNIHVAPFGTTLPAEVDTTLDVAFVDTGYVNDAGVTLTVTPTIAAVQAWQKLSPIRNIVTARALTAAMSLEQWNQETLALAFGGGTWTMVTPGSYAYTPPADGDALTNYSVVIDARDGDKNLRWVIRKANVTDAVATNLVNTATALLPITFTALTPDDQSSAWYFCSDAVEFSIAS
jgi:hypothetical protein